jgi:hypothetical protein
MRYHGAAAGAHHQQETLPSLLAQISGTDGAICCVRLAHKYDVYTAEGPVKVSEVVLAGSSSDEHRAWQAAVVASDWLGLGKQPGVPVQLRTDVVSR